MANPIPPLLCSTPPPIDFDEESSANNDTNDEFSEFDTGDTETFEGQSLPSTPKHLFHTINKKLDPDLETTYKTATTENEEYKNNSSTLDVLETESYTDVNVKVLENNVDTFSDFEKSSENEKSLELVSSSLSDSEFGEKNSIENTELHEKDKIIQSDFEKVMPIEGQDLNNQNEEDDLSASKNEPIHSSIENMNENNSDNFTTELKTDRIESTSLITNLSDEIENFSNTIANDKDEIILEENENCESNIDSQWSDTKNTDEEQCIFTFEADFSQFQSFDSNETKNINEINNTISAIASVESKEEVNFKESIDDEFENFQNYSSETEDNDFNEFSDFKEAAPPPLLHENSISSSCFMTNSNLKDNIKATLNSMFPLNDSDNNSNMGINVQNDCQKFSIILKCVDSADALNFQWSNSKIKQSLVKAIGIDSRNILHGEKWNSSMPRFAVNLGFNPLEPLKPTKLDSTPNTTNFLENEPSTSAEKTVHSRSDVPAVEFDWNTSGLVNPLDGIKEIAHEGKTETLHTASSGELHDTIEQLSKSEPNEPSCSGSSNFNDTKSFVKIHKDEESNRTKEYLSTFDTNLITDQSSGSNIQENITNLERLTYTNYKSSENINISTSSSSNPNTFIVPLKETHIFTPNKGDAAVSRSTTNISESTANGKCGPIDFDYEIAAAGTVIDETVIKKEYRDIEYNPSKFIINSDMNSIQLNGYENSPDGEKTEIIEGPYINEANIVNDDWNFYNTTVKNEISDIYSLDNTLKNKHNDKNLSKQLSIDTNDDFSSFQKASTVEKFNNFSKPTIGLSPTENFIAINKINKQNRKFEDCKINENSCADDEFTDFQFVPPSSTLTTNTLPISISNVTDVKIPQSKLIDNEKRNRTNTLDQMILSPAILLPQSVQINSEPKIDWPEPGIDPEELARIETLFPSSKQNNFHNQASTSLNRTANNENTNISSVNDDDWSDFISVSAVSTVEHNLNTIYCPKSPTKVSKSTPTTSDFNNDDEWSDFISSTPTTQNSINSEQYNKITVHNNCYKPVISGTNMSQQNYKNIFPNPIIVNSNNDHTLRNNKICHYLLNNGNVESKNTMHLNSVKTPDFIPHYQQKQDIINQQNINKNQSNHHKITPSISLIPDLGYVAPQNFISIPKKKIQKK